VQGLRADDDRVEAEVVVVGVPRAVVDPAEQAEEVERVDAAAVGDAVLAVGREDVVLRTQRAAGADLRGLLAEQLGPMPSSPCRWRAVASVSMRRVRTMSR
jgi:hypothetical protein